MNKEILKLAIPNIISNITIPLLGMADLAILGHLESEIYIGAIALGGIIFNFIYWGFSFLRMGTSGFTAQAFGKKDSKEIILILSRALIIALVAGLFLIIIQKPIELFSFWLFNADSNVEQLASEYYRIRIWAAPATIGLYAFIGWFIGMQNAVYPMIISIIINVLNIALNVFFVFVLGMKSEGVALGTVIAQYTGVVIAVLLFIYKYKPYLFHWVKAEMFDRLALKQFFNVNKDILIRTLCLIFVFSFFTAQSAVVNNTILAVNTLLLQFLFLFSYFIDGFAHAAESLTGKFIGAKDNVSLKKFIKIVFVWGIALSIPFSLAYIFAGKNILFILTDNANIILQTKPYLFWIAIIPLITFAAFIWDGIYIGATASKYMRNNMLVSTFLIFLPLYYLFRNSLGNHSLWLALMVFMFARGLMLTAWSKKAINIKN
ncbi:MAG: MATE family efflux transporter [Bacteroidota bacterium]|nr:MATE family efflux transporter [Bacteroidota bacterium]